MDRRSFLLGTAACGVAAACAAPERDLLTPYEGVDIPLQPGTVPPPPDGSPLEVVPDDGQATAPVDPLTGLPVSVPVEDLPGLSFVARVKPEVASVTVDEVLGSGDARWSFANPIESGGPLVFLIDEFDGLDHYRVLLPTRPNGSLGWIDAADVDIDRHNFRILVDLDEFRVAVLDHETEVFSTLAGVARDNAPTPRGRYYLTEIIRSVDPDGAYGPYAYGLSGYSDTFTAFNGGPGQLGIHGTNDPDSIGTNVSSGCIRVRNEDIAHIVEDLKVPTGTPVEVI